MKADFNNDGFEDFFIGGAKFQRGKIFLSNKNNGYEEVKNMDLQKDNIFEDTDAQLLILTKMETLIFMLLVVEMSTKNWTKIIWIVSI